MGDGVVASVLAARRQGYDAIYPYLLAHAVAHGEPVYDPQWRMAHATLLTGLVPPQEGVFYPPAVGIVLLPLAALPFGTARMALLLACVGATILAVWGIFALARPATRWPTRITVAGLVVLTASMRWCWTPIQIAPLTLLLLVIAVWGLHRDRPWVAFVATAVALALKFTLGLPFLALLLLHRRFKMAIGAVAVYVAMTGVAFLRVGGSAAVDAYRTESLHLERLGTINTPDFWDLASSPRADWTYLFTGLTHNATASRTIALALGIVFGLLICAVCLRMPRQLSVSDSALVALAASCLGLLAVYHHHYDLAVLIAPLLLIALLRDDTGRHRSWRILLTMAPLYFLMVFVPVDVATRFMKSLFGDRGVGLVNASFPVATTVAFVGSIIVLVRSVGTLGDWRAWMTTMLGRARVRRSEAQQRATS
jgi:hypothetical protein